MVAKEKKNNKNSKKVISRKQKNVVIQKNTTFTGEL
jgi:hypothetical protein